MIAGLWTAEFGSSAGIYSGGVIIFENGKILGGDGGYFYTGDYRVNEDQFSATLVIYPFIDDYLSIFKTVNQKLTLSLSGSVFSPQGPLVAKGHSTEKPNWVFGVKFTKRPV